MSRAVPAAFLVASATTLSACADPPPEDFGTVMIELQRAPAEGDTNPFIGTHFVSIFLEYEPCLADFYMVEHTEWQFEGVEGSEVLMEWRDGRLCDKKAYGKNRPIPKCAVDQMYQTLEDGADTREARLNVRLLIEEENIEGLYLPVGPLPTQHRAGCEPIVRLAGGSVQGLSADQASIWRISTFDEDLAAVGQGAALKIQVESSD